MIVTELNALVKPTQQVLFPLSLEMQDIIKEIYLTLADKTNAIGVAAIQLGYDYSIFGMYVNGEIIICINPTYEDSQGKFVVFSEGCLSFPGKR